MPGKHLAVAALLALATAPAISQLDQSRFELPLLNAGEIQPSVISLGTDGLLLYRRFTAFRETDQLEVTRVDTAFQQVWSGFIEIDNNLSMVDTESTERQVFLLLRNRIMAYASFQIISLEKESGRYQTYTVSSQIPMVPMEFRMTQRAALIAGYFNRKPLVLYYDLNVRRAKILPGFFNTAGEITQLEVDAQGFIEVIFSMRMVDKKKELWVRTYDPEGNLIRNNVLRADDRLNLIFGRSVTTSDGIKVVAGVYGNRFSEYSRGVFVARLDNEGESNIRYYNYSELRYFFNYMKAGRQQRVRDRIERKKVKGKEAKFNYRLLVHELIPHDGKYLLLGEAFYPKYRYYYGSTPNNPYRSPLLFGMPLARSEPVFDGFQYTHAVVLAIRPDGQLAWDNSFEINGVKTFELDQFVKLQIRGPQVALLYMYGNEIRGKIVDDNDVTEAKTYDPILLRFNDDRVPPNGTEVSRLDYWFGQTLFTSGVQRIQNLRDSDVLTHRRVFFINKIRYR
jgi:hypothetical protein